MLDSGAGTDALDLRGLHLYHAPSRAPSARGSRMYCDVDGAKTVMYRLLSFLV